jgi:hypothetical protein
MKMPIKVKYVDHGDFFEHMALLNKLVHEFNFSPAEV